MNTARCYSVCNPIARNDLFRSLGNRAIAAAMVLSLGGWTVIRIDQQGATTTVTRRFGVVTIAPGSKNARVSVTSFHRRAVIASAEDKLKNDQELTYGW